MLPVVTQFPPQQQGIAPLTRFETTDHRRYSVPSPLAPGAVGIPTITISSSTVLPWHVEIGATDGRRRLSPVCSDGECPTAESDANGSRYRLGRRSTPRNRHRLWPMWTRARALLLL